MTAKKKWILAAGLAGLAAVTWGLDSLSLALGVPARPATSTYTIRRYYYIHEKYNKYSFESAPSIEEECVNALFPHAGKRPCWYVSRHTRSTIEVD